MAALRVADVGTPAGVAVRSGAREIVGVNRGDVPAAATDELLETARA